MSAAQAAGYRLRPAATACTSTVFLLAAIVAWNAAGLVRSDVTYTGLETEVSFWGRGDYIPDATTRAETADALAALLVRAPEQPDYLGLAANLYAWQAYWAEGEVEEYRYSRLAVNTQYKAQVSRPAYRQGWEKMLRYAGTMAGLDEQRNQATQRLAALGVGEESMLPDATTE